MLTYATADDLGAYTTEIPDDVHVYIMAASNLVRGATRAARYEVDQAGKPVDPWHIDAMKSAVCWTVVEWITAGLHPAGGKAGQDPVPASSSIAGGTVAYDAPGQRAAEAASLDHLGTLALNELRDAGLLYAGIRT